MVLRRQGHWHMKPHKPSTSLSCVLSLILQTIALYQIEQLKHILKNWSFKLPLLMGNRKNIHEQLEGECSSSEPGRTVTLPLECGDRWSLRGAYPIVLYNGQKLPGEPQLHPPPA